MSASIKITINADVIRRMHQHGRSSMKAEICGVLIGEHEEGRTIVDDCIRGEHSDQGGAHVTFTHDTWEHIYKIKDADFPDKKIVGWYHSHPGFGIFLSDHDLFIHKNYFSAAHQVAWVYDPHSDEEGCFVWEEGRIERIETIEVLDTGPPPGDEPMQEPDPETIQITTNEAENGADESQKSSGSNTGMLLLLCLITAVAGFLLGKTTVMPVEKNGEKQAGEINATDIHVTQLAKEIQMLPALPKEKLKEQIRFLNRIPAGYSIVEMQPRQIVGGAGLPRPDVPNIIIHHATNGEIQSRLAKLHALIVGFNSLNMSGNLVIRDWQIPNFLPPGLMIVHRDNRSNTIAATLPYDASFQSRLEQIARKIRLLKVEAARPAAKGNATAPAGNATLLAGNATAPTGNATLPTGNATAPAGNATAPAVNATAQPSKPRPKSP